mmetsp:Transcript_18416/g.31498  ORF Transcript_18416/g.31498 Transcript_18416/m.31498 type:complete len:122 (+) Transcript_18416:481-846(+)|eukprot:CAMPEP_0168617816 /NCGR_PEP_ID=MMETSP0449_2-20121227/5744_1 /TAXON_ID=1082188 /ORGANISM="Strombidium rassoulzadegani, Strain ras09" /LENGTH=121 /DNA_ID=CAMNT_0008658657 /DNA_START=435 /DNA_END=800 /DNA_ORIENTATION=-
MAVQISGTVLHVVNNYLLVYHFELGVAGTGLAGLVTNSYLFVMNRYFTQRVEEIREANEVSFTDPQIRSQLGMYFKIGAPTMAVMCFDWSCFELMTIMAGYLGVVEQATQVLLLNLLAQVF